MKIPAGTRTVIDTARLRLGQGWWITSQYYDDEGFELDAEGLLTEPLPSLAIAHANTEVCRRAFAAIGVEYQYETAREALP